MIGPGIFVLGVIVVAAHNTPGDVVGGIIIATIGIALWAGRLVSRR